MLDRVLTTPPYEIKKNSKQKSFPDLYYQNNEVSEILRANFTLRSH